MYPLKVENMKGFTAGFVILIFFCTTEAFKHYETCQMVYSNESTKIKNEESCLMDDQNLLLKEGFNIDVPKLNWKSSFIDDFITTSDSPRRNNIKNTDSLSARTTRFTNRLSDFTRGGKLMLEEPKYFRNSERRISVGRSISKRSTDEERTSRLTRSRKTIRDTLSINDKKENWDIPHSSVETNIQSRRRSTNYPSNFIRNSRLQGRITSRRNSLDREEYRNTRRTPAEDRRQSTSTAHRIDKANVSSYRNSPILQLVSFRESHQSMSTKNRNIRDDDMNRHRNIRDTSNERRSNDMNNENREIRDLFTRQTTQFIRERRQSRRYGYQEDRDSSRTTGTRKRLTRETSLNRRSTDMRKKDQNEVENINSYESQQREISGRFYRRISSNISQQRIIRNGFATSAFRERINDMSSENRERLNNNRNIRRLTRAVQSEHPSEEGSRTVREIREFSPTEGNFRETTSFDISRVRRRTYDLRDTRRESLDERRIIERASRSSRSGIEQIRNDERIGRRRGESKDVFSQSRRFSRSTWNFQRKSADISRNRRNALKNSDVERYANLRVRKASRSDDSASENHRIVRGYEESDNELSSALSSRRMSRSRRNALKNSDVERYANLQVRKASRSGNSAGENHRIVRGNEESDMELSSALNSRRMSNFVSQRRNSGNDRRLNSDIQREARFARLSSSSERSNIRDDIRRETIREPSIDFRRTTLLRTQENTRNSQSSSRRFRNARNLSLETRTHRMLGSQRRFAPSEMSEEKKGTQRVTSTLLPHKRTANEFRDVQNILENNYIVKESENIESSKAKRIEFLSSSSRMALRKFDRSNRKSESRGASLKQSGQHKNLENIEPWFRLLQITLAVIVLGQLAYNESNEKNRFSISCFWRKWKNHV